MEGLPVGVSGHSPIPHGSSFDILSNMAAKMSFFIKSWPGRIVGVMLVSLTLGAIMGEIRLYALRKETIQIKKDTIEIRILTDINKQILMDNTKFLIENKANWDFVMRQLEANRKQIKETEKKVDDVTREDK